MSNFIPNQILKALQLNSNFALKADMNGNPTNKFSVAESTRDFDAVPYTQLRAAGLLGATFTNHAAFTSALPSLADGIYNIEADESITGSPRSIYSVTAGAASLVFAAASAATLASTDAGRGASTVSFQGSTGTVQDLTGTGGAGLIGSTAGHVQSDIDARPTSAALAATTGAGLVGTSNGNTAQAELNLKPQIFANAAAVRAYTAVGGVNYPAIIVTSADGACGTFYRDATDTTSAEDGASFCGTILRPADYATNGVYKRKFNGFADPQWWGAFGAGDDFTSLQNAIIACAYKNALLISLTHTTTSQLELANGSVISALKGKGSITFSGSMANANVLNGASVNSIYIQNLELIGDLTANASAIQYGAGIRLKDCNDVVIENNYVHNFVQAGISIGTSQFGGSARGVIRNNRVDSISSIGATYVAGIHGVSLQDGVSDWDVYNNTVTNIGTAANNTAGIGIIAYQLNTGWTTPDGIRMRRNVVSNTCQHGIAQYASQLPTAEYHPMSAIDENRVENTGLAATVGGGGIANALGNGIYCEQLIPGTIDGNTTYNTHVNAVSTTIADDAIAAMVNGSSPILEASLSITGNSSVLCNRGGLRLQGISGFTISGHIAQSCKTNGLQLSTCSNFSAVGAFSGASATGAGITFGTGGGGTLATGVSNGVLDIQTKGFADAADLTFASNINGKLNISAYTTRGYYPTSCQDVNLDIFSTYESDLRAIYAASANTNCTVRLRGPNRTGSNTPYIYNSSTGLRIEFEADSLPNSAVMAFGVGDMARYRAPTAGAPDYARCVTGGASGTYVWKEAQALTSVIGSFTLAAAASTVVADAIVTSSSTIEFAPTNASAATLMGSTKSLYVTVSSGSFTMHTADATSAVGTETFSYRVN